jgi:hypothetical protein
MQNLFYQVPLKIQVTLNKVWRLGQGHTIRLWLKKGSFLTKIKIRDLINLSDMKMRLKNPLLFRVQYHVNFILTPRIYADNSSITLLKTT